MCANVLLCQSIDQLKEAKVIRELNAYTPLSISTYLQYVATLEISSFIEDKVLFDAFYEGYRLGRITEKELEYFDRGLYEFFKIVSLKEGFIMIKGVIFDFDGLIVDTETSWFEAFKEVIWEKHQINLDLVRYSSCIGTGNEVLYRYFREIAGEAINCELLEEEAAIKYENLMKAPELREGVKQYLEEAKLHNFKVALASSSSREWVHSYLEKLNIKDYFEIINTKDDVSKIKPDPELYTKTLADLGLSSEEAIVFEDSLNGLRAAKLAGIRCIIVPNSVTRHLKFEHFDARLESMSDITLIELLQRIEGI